MALGGLVRLANGCAAGRVLAGCILILGISRYYSRKANWAERAGDLEKVLSARPVARSFLLNVHRNGACCRLDFSL